MNDPTRTTAPDPVRRPGDATLSTPVGLHGGDRDTAVPTDGGPTPPPDPPPGFELLEEVGRGGMGVVYRARDLSLRREVAVKVLQDQYAPTSGTASRFVEEACITGQLQHPGIPAVYQVGRLPDWRPFLAMKLIKGRTLQALLDDKSPLDPLAVFEAIAQAVGYAHAHGVIHRDIKPANVMVGAFGEVQVMDWGLAKVVGEPDPVPGPESGSGSGSGERIFSLRESDGTFTQAGSVIGTPAYMAPEQANGESAAIGPPSDVFGLGGMLAVLLTGEPTFVGWDAEVTWKLAAAGRVGDCFARLDRSGAAPEVIALAKRCLAPAPADRPPTANEVAVAVAALRRAAEDRAEQAEREKATTAVRAAEQAKRHRAVAWASAAVALMLLLGVIGTKLGLDRAEKARAAAEASEETAEAKRAEAETARAAAEAAKTAAEVARTAEASERKKADHARKVAVENEAAAQAVVRFFEEKVFSAARPLGQSGGLGKDVTLRKAIETAIPSLGTDFTKQPLVEARLRRTLSSALHDIGDIKGALEQARAAWALYQHLDPDHYHRLWASITVASAENANGNNAEAIRVSEDALARARRVLGPDDDLVFHIMNNLANYYTGALRYQEALDLRNQVLERHKAKYPPTHEKTLLAMYNLSRSMYNLKRHDEALELREQVLAGRRATLPADHPYTLLAMNRLAASYVAVGRDADALALREKTAEGQRAVLPADHPDLLTTLHELAHSYTVAGRYKDAVPLREEVLAARRRVYPRDHGQISQALGEMAYAYINVGRKADAIPIREELFESRRRRYGPNDPLTLRATSLLAYSYATNGRRAEALKLREDAQPWFDKNIGPTHPDTLINLRGIVDGLVRLDRSAEAIPVIDLCVARGNPTDDSRMLSAVLDYRLRHFQQAGDAAGCRATAEMYEKLGWTDSGGLYDAACNRAIAAGLYAKAGRPSESAADADRAAALLARAVAAGWRNRGHAEADDDLASLRGRLDFWAVVAPLPYVAPPPRAKR